MTKDIRYKNFVQLLPDNLTWWAVKRELVFHTWKSLLNRLTNEQLSQSTLKFILCY